MRKERRKERTESKEQREAGKRERGAEKIKRSVYDDSGCIRAETTKPGPVREGGGRCRRRVTGSRMQQ